MDTALHELASQTLTERRTQWVSVTAKCDACHTISPPSQPYTLDYCGTICVVRV